MFYLDEVTNHAHIESYFYYWCLDLNPLKMENQIVKFYFDEIQTTGYEYSYTFNGFLQVDNKYDLTLSEDIVEETRSVELNKEKIKIGEGE